MKQVMKLGVTDRSVLVFIPDSAQTDGSGKTGLVAANLTVSYTRVETDNDVVVTDVTSSLSDLSALTDAHADWGLKEVSSTLAPGLYRLDIADAVFASGAWSAVVYVMVTTSSAAPSPMEFILVAYDELDSVRMGLTALPNAAADAAGGLPISDAGGLDLDAQIGTDIDAILVDTSTTLQGELDGIQTDTEDIQARIPAALTADGNIKADTLRIGGTLQTAGDVPAMITAVDDFVDTEITAIKAKTDNLPSDPADASVVAGLIAAVEAKVDIIDTNVDSVLADTGTDGVVLANDAITSAKIATNAIDADALAADAVTEIWAKAIVEPTAVTGATPTVLGVLAWLHALARNKITQTATTQTLLADDGTTPIAASAVSDDGTTFTRGEFV